MDKSFLLAAACLAFAGAASAQSAPPPDMQPPHGREARHEAMEACKASVTMAQGKAGMRECMASKGFVMRERERPPGSPPGGAPPMVERGVVVPSQ
ncbi:MAG TPA: hypothetical protein VGI11_19835 [Variovorax sp.]|jgi:hypothetical protein